ncbi:MAG TPA: hypothetical protein VFE62_01595 [Gemmataceae bacterium]|nr:hypothetical protein [Gemmataceae bacterium]
MKAAGTDDAFRVSGKALGIDTDNIDDTGNIDLDRCVEVAIGVPVKIDPDDPSRLRACSIEITGRVAQRQPYWPGNEPGCFC